ncbi:MAG: cobalamin biosynthesis protein CobQ [Candidatus Levybacteria bacterium]|nr:cobalamin biosynthesis protein CobQ [Candidatus Levybacteria bacterium]
MNKRKQSLTIGWLYPTLMSTYGDRGNIIVLQKRCEWRGIEVKVEHISTDTNKSKLDSCDLIFMGGAQDTQQEIVNQDLFKVKGEALRKKIEEDTPGLYICGAYQFLGKYYKTADGKELPGLGIFPAYTENPGEKTERLIGNIIVSSQLSAVSSQLVGFENHGGRTYLEDASLAFGKVIKGFGNNGNDSTEGILYKNSIGTYLHGPILPKNPEIADWLIQKALEKKYNEEIKLENLEDTLENKAKNAIL